MMRNRFTEDCYDSEIGCFSDNRYHCGGGGSKSSTTTTKPSPAQEAILLEQLSLEQGLKQKGELQFFPGQTLAREDPLTGLGQQLQIGGAAGIAGLSPDILASVQRLLGADIVGDPRTEALAQAVTRPLEQQFQEQTLPAISSAATQQGAFGGDRANILKAQAARDFSQVTGDVRAKVFADALRQGLGAQQGAIAGLPNVFQGLLQPSREVLDVGAQRQDRSQQEIEAARERFEFGQFAPTDLANRLNTILSGLNFGTISTSKTSGGGK